jgi:hypothetical protein
MLLRDNPSFYKFEIYAQGKRDCEITQDALNRVKEILGPAPLPETRGPNSFGSQSMRDLQASCAAMERAVRILWACAAATDQIEPPIWDYTSDYESALEYFNLLTPLQLMQLTEAHRLTWDLTIHLKGESVMRTQKLRA